jgi:regulatory protein
LLARREHSTGELGRKLESRGYDAEVTSEVLAELGRKGLLSDERYVASFITHHAARGQGPMRIRSELRESGVAAELVERLLDEAEVDWLDVARSVRRKKFSGPLPASFAERAKQSRFLQYRGFSQDQIRAAFGPDAGVDPDFASDPGL